MSEIYRPQKCYQQLLIMKYQRWQREVDRSRARHRGRAEEPADEPPTKERLKLHDELQKAESSLLVQMRTGKIGLRAFLFERRVPDVMTPVCSCGDGWGKVYHGGRMISEGANIYTWWTFTSGVKLANIGLVKKH